jgi:ubiquitin-conjugating enzyme E2 Q
MPEQLVKMAFIDEEEDDETDAKLLKAPAPSFMPSSSERFAKLRLMPPPTETSSVASKALQKEFKSLVKLQEKDELPFYIDPGTDSRVPLSFLSSK